MQEGAWVVPGEGLWMDHISDTLTLEAWLSLERLPLAGLLLELVKGSNPDSTSQPTLFLGLQGPLSTCLINHRAKEQTSRDSSYASEPTEIIQTSQF